MFIGANARAAHVVDEADDFRVSSTAYDDPAVFAEELERIFGRSWIYLGHESEVPKTGDYKSTWIGHKPVFMIRDGAGQVNAFMNACPHRGAALCRGEYGNSRVIVCPYHAWAFKPTGELLKIPEAERYPERFRALPVRLYPVPRVATRAGLVFGCLDPAVESLEAFLGEALPYLDAWAARAADGAFTVGAANKYSYPGNWKLQTENVVDGYHAHIVHQSAFAAMRKVALADAEAAEAEAAASGNAALATIAEVRRKRAAAFGRTTGTSELGVTKGFAGGHSLLSMGVVFESLFVNPADSQAYMDRIRALHGEERAPQILLNRHLAIFPNLALMDHVIRVWHPVAVDRTEVHSYALRNAAIAPTLDAARVIDVQMSYSAAGTVAPDDADVFAGIQTGIRSGLPELLHFSRGMAQETVSDGDVRTGAMSDEVPQRAFWRGWQRLMATEGAAA